jgi:hypothetical protein
MCRLSHLLPMHIPAGSVRGICYRDDNASDQSNDLVEPIFNICGFVFLHFDFPQKNELLSSTRSRVYNRSSSWGPLEKLSRTTTLGPKLNSMTVLLLYALVRNWENITALHFEPLERSVRTLMAVVYRANVGPLLNFALLIVTLSS